MRRRMWGHIAALDSQSATMDGSESILTPLGDVQRSHNANDSDWQPSPLVGTDPGPRDREGFSDAAAALMRRELSRACYTISEARKTTSNCEDLVAIVEETQRYLQFKFVNHFDGSDPMHLVITHWYNAMIKSLHVSVLYFHASPSKLKLHCHVFEQLQGQYANHSSHLASSANHTRLYDDCLACLEEFERGENAATPHHWQWAFRWPMPIHIVAGLLSGLARQPDHPDTERAWQQIDVVFRRYNNEDISMAKIPAWTTIENLCDQAIGKHPGRSHEGRSYTNRLHKSNPPAGPPTMWELHKPEDLSQLSSCKLGFYDNSLSHSNLTEMLSAPGMNFGFTNSDIDTIFFNLNEHNEFPSIDI